VSFKGLFVCRATLIAVLGFFLVGIASAQSASPPAAAGGYRDPELLRQLISDKTEAYSLVDVRTSGEYERGHIPSAINIPYDVISERPPTSETSTLIIVYCASGNRSAKARQSLEAMAYSRVVDFGAFSRWKGSVVTGPDPGECPCTVE
jgi:rhodanese-related sulfurtransferase